MRAMIVHADGAGQRIHVRCSGVERPGPRPHRRASPRAPGRRGKDSGRTPKHPETELDARYSAALNPRPGAEDVTATERAEAGRRLRAAEIFWITTVRPDGRLHGTPLIAAWHDGALHFSTGSGDEAIAAFKYGFGHDGRVFSHTRYTFT